MFFIDRVEEGICVIYDEDSFIENVEKENVKGNARDGAVVVKDNGIWTVDEYESKRRNDKMKERLEGLFKRG